MITASFRHIRGIGGLRERQLWLRGVGSWDAIPSGDVLSPRLDGKLREGCAESRARLDAADWEFFGAALPITEHWRLLPQVLADAAYLDLEAGEGDQLSVIGVLDRHGLKSFRRGRDLGEFSERARTWKALVTFNGAAYDVPMLKRTFPLFEAPPVHIDLRHVFQKLREKGGLKELEQRFGFFRPPHLARLSGMDAVALWRERDTPGAMRRLVEYNLYDVFHLKPLAELGYNRLVKRTGMPAAEIPVTERGAMLYDVSKAVEAALS